MATVGRWRPSNPAGWGEPRELSPLPPLLQQQTKLWQTEIQRQEDTRPQVRPCLVLTKKLGSHSTSLTLPPVVFPCWGHQALYSSHTHMTSWPQQKCYFCKRNLNVRFSKREAFPDHHPHLNLHISSVIFNCAVLFICSMNSSNLNMTFTFVLI